MNHRQQFSKAFYVATKTSWKPPLHVLHLQEEKKCVLYIKEVYPEDSGIFTCRSTNPAGVAECSAELLVEGTPTWRHHNRRRCCCYSVCVFIKHACVVFWLQPVAQLFSCFVHRRRVVSVDAANHALSTRTSPVQTNNRCAHKSTHKLMDAC